MTSHIKLLERLIRHQLMIQRFGGSQVKKSLPILRALARDLRKRIQAGDATEFQMGRMQALEADIQLIVRGAVDSLQDELDLEDFATQEVEFTRKLLGAAVSVDLTEGTTLDIVRAVTTQRQMRLVSGDKVKRLTIRQAFDEFADAASLDAMRIVQAGVIEGRTHQEMARGVAEIVQTRSRRQAETVVRTSVNHIGGAARDSVYQANSDVLDGLKWVSTLDGRTSDSCRARDSVVFPLNSGPRPPGHFNCRSVMVPLVKEEYRLSIQGERASMNGPVSNQLSYGGWLKRQTPEFIDDVLGPRRGKLFRDGDLKIEQFVDDQGRTLTLDELAQRYDLTME